MRARIVQKTKPPLLNFCLDLLERNPPDYDGLQGWSKVTLAPATSCTRTGTSQPIVHWELAHIGDPMDVIA